MSKILITGAAGFIGSHLYEKLKKNNEVIGIDNFFHSSTHPLTKEVRYCDVRYYQDIEKFIDWADVVFHLAAQIHVDRSLISPIETTDININGTLNVLEAVHKYGKKMVFASSSEVYGTAQKSFIDEKHPLDAQSPYAASKVAGDRYCKAYYDSFGTQVAILRNFNTFGPYQADDSYGGVIAIFTRKALLGEPLVVYGDGEQERDYMSVQDAVGGYEFCIQEELWGQPINIGTGKTVTINELALKIKKLTKSKSKIIHGEPRPGEVRCLRADTTFATDKGFKIKTKFDDNLKEYVQWYKDTILPTLSK